jgi:type II secretion system protein G
MGSSAKQAKDTKRVTLIELLIIVILLAILSAVAVPSYLSMRDRAKESATEAQMRNIITAIEMYYADRGEYPATADASDLSNVLASYMQDVPVKDFWGNDYIYMKTEEGYSLLSDGIRGKHPIIYNNGQIANEGKYPNRQ